MTRSIMHAEDVRDQGSRRRVEHSLGFEMEVVVKKYQQRFRKVKEERENWNELQSRLISQFTNASSIIQRLQVLTQFFCHVPEAASNSRGLFILLFHPLIKECIFMQILQDSKNYGALQCVEGIQEAVLLKQMNSLQTILFSMNETMEKFHSVVLSLEKLVRDGRQLIKGGSVQITVKQLQQRIGIKPCIADCLDGLNLLSEMHQSEYRLKLSVISALSAVALKHSGSDDLGALQQLLVDQPNIPKEEGLHST
ncbi:uncharacterized protein At5g43822 isoform X2 [Capsicum annuum]|uniref:uncharacterized protein At5g43822 isoform X2 n=1 Tax=Capsicum annuum TaxID=4072 RepID=UPI001FB07F7E|nr:uncharacterized protein At5g43822 isoform X2 [Capsicum annuum]